MQNPNTKIKLMGKNLKINKNIGTFFLTACTLPKIIKEDKIFMESYKTQKRQSPSFTLKNFIIASAMLPLFSDTFHMALKQLLQCLVSMNFELKIHGC